MEVDKSLLMEDEQLHQLVVALLDSSETCPEILLDMEPHPSDKTLAMFAHLVYTKKTSEGKMVPLGKLDGWRLMITANNTDFSNGYFGAAFYHTGLQQVVVAHRGTDPKCFGAVYTDIAGIFGTNYTSCMNSAITFVDSIRQIIILANSQYNRHYTLTITGHSLGAWLAQITAFSVKYLAVKRIESQSRLEKSDAGIHAKTVGFDSPGARDMLARVLNDHYHRYEMNVPRLDGLDITLYLSAPNHINTCGVHLGRIYRIHNDVSNFKWIDKTITYTFKSHAMNNFVDAFKNDKCTFGEVLDWATGIIEYKKLFKILNWDNNYHGHATVNNPVDLKKFLRYKVAENRDIFKSSFRVFSEVELQMLFRMHILQEQKSKLIILNEFIKNNKLKVESNKLLPKFDLNHYKRTITCESEESLVELCKRLKQLMRWLKPQFTQAVEEQIKVFNRAADLIYYVEGQSYLDSLPKCWLDFMGSDSFKKFLVSDKERVICLVTSSKDVAFQMTRIRNILHQISNEERRSNDSSVGSTKLITKNLYTFIRWSQLQKLQYYGWPIEKGYLMVVDCTSSTITVKDRIQLIQEVCSKSLKLVLIVSEPMDTSKSNKFNKTLNFGSNVNFSDLTPDSQEIMFNRVDVITIGEKEYSFERFLGEDRSVCNINQILSSEDLKCFATIENYSINIEDTRPTLSDTQMPFFKLNIKTSMDFFVNCVKSPNTNILVVMSGLSREGLETGARWDQLKGMEIILAEVNAQLSFRDTCKKNQDKSIYLFEVLGQDVYCKELFNRHFYLGRKFLHRAYIDVKKFAETEHPDDLFVINSEINKKLLLEFTENSTKREVFTESILIAPTKEEENIIQKYVNKRTHFVKIFQDEESYKLEWRYSRGSVENLLPFMSTDSCEPINETTLSKSERNLIIITDEPGMGKTTSLSRLSRLIETPWVIYIQLKHFQAHIRDKLLDKLTEKCVASFLLSECCTKTDCSPVHGLLEYLLQSKTPSKRVVLMFDGFDEIDDYVQRKESSKDKLVRLFAFLQGKPAIQTFITARKYLKESLEDELSQISTCFVKINAQEQQHYLFVFWSSCLSLELGDYGEEEEGRLKEYAGEVLRQAKEVLGPDMDCFMGVPLQLRMLAEVFRPQSDLLRQSPELLFKQINIVSTPDLYKKFIDLKYQIYLQEKTSKGEELDEDEIIKYIEFVTKTHGELAIRSFFPSFYNENFDTIEDKWLNKLNRHGLVQSEGNGGFQFVHRTYAEYCCAQMVVHWLNQRTFHCRYELIKETLVSQILLHPDSKIIRLFINVQLNEIPMSKTALDLNAKCISRLWLEDSSIFRNQEHQTALHIAVLEKNEQIVNFLLSGVNLESTQETIVSLITQYDIYNNTALHMPNLYNISEDDLVLDGITTSLLQCFQTCSDETKENIFFASLFNRNVSNSDESEENLFFARLFNQNNIFAAKETKEELIVINSIYRLIKNYLSCTARIFDRVKKVELVITPFKEAIIHNKVDIAREILSKQVKNNIERYCLLLMKHKDHYGQTALHLAAECGHLDMVKLILEQTAVPFVVLLAQWDDWRRTPLHRAAEEGQLNVVKYLVERGADIKTRSGDGMSALIYAAMSGQLGTVAYLIESGADINATDNDGTTALYGAAFWGRLPVVEYLLQQGADPDRVDRGGRSALTGASRERRWDVVQLLLERGADVNADGGKALRYVIFIGEWSKVKAFVDKGAVAEESTIWKNLHEFKEKFPNYEFKK